MKRNQPPNLSVQVTARVEPFWRLKLYCKDIALSKPVEALAAPDFCVTPQKGSLTVGIETMKIIYITLVLICLLLLPSVSIGSFFGCDEKRAGLTAVVTPEKKIKPVEAFESLLDEAVQQIRRDDRYNNIILFVHGMGQHPCHAFDKSLISDMQTDYSAKVIMFHWPSWEGLLTFPEENAKSSAKDFKKVLLALEEFQKEKAELIGNIKVTLMTHSMGGIVLEEFIRSERGEAISNIFDTILINASASSGKNHAEWVQKIRMSNNIYVTVNLHDPTLGKAELHEEFDHDQKDQSRLGKRLISKNGVKVALANNAKYVDVTASDLRHVYYLHRYLKREPAVKYFFDRVLNGLPVKFNKTHGLKKVERKQIYILE